MPRRLPSLSWLRVFEAASRHLSFTRAAVELNMTQTAVSHQIKGLEDFLKTKLFIREPGGAVMLSRAGTEYVSTVRGALAEIALASDRIMDHQADHTLSIACLSSFAMKCLIPCLPGFKALHPDYSLRVRTLWTTEEARRQDYDIAFLYDSGGGRLPDMVIHEMGREEVFPVCSPDLLKGRTALWRPSDLQRQTVILTESHILSDEWPAWLKQAGEPGLSFKDEMRFTTLITGIQACVEGLGVLMGRTPHVRADLASGKLVEPFSIRLSSGAAWYAAIPPDTANVPKVRVFMDWATQIFAPSFFDDRCLRSGGV